MHCITDNPHVPCFQATALLDLSFVDSLRHLFRRDYRQQDCVPIGPARVWLLLARTELLMSPCIVGLTTRSVLAADCIHWQGCRLLEPTAQHTWVCASWSPVYPL